MAKIKPFESFSEEYDNWFIRNEDKYKLELQAIEYFISSESNGLEVGVGSGKFAGPLGIKTGIEPSARMANKARDSGIKVIEGVAEDLPFPNNSFDFVLFVTTICFVDDINKTFQEAFRVIEEGGFIVIGFVDKESKLGRKYILNRDTSKFYKIAEFFSTREVLHYLKYAGFGNFEIKQTIIPGNHTESIQNGFGKGSFVVIKGSKLTD